MVRMVVLIGGIFAGLGMSGHFSATARGDETLYRAGLASVDITPDYPIRLNGFGFRREESEGVTQPIYAKALAVQHGEDPPIVILAIDSLGIRESMVNEVARRLESKGVSRQRLALTFSHSHTTPKVNGACDTIFSSPIPDDHQQHIDRYTDELTDALERAALQALEDLRPAKLAWSVGKVEFAKNRRSQGGPVDHDLPMLVVKDPEGNLRGIYVSYACHCVTLSNNKISGDWAGYAQEMIERGHPGCVALVSIGCGSDANPLSGVVGDKVDVAADQGGQIAREVERLLEQPLREVTGPLSAQLTYVDLPLHEPPSREQLEQLAEQTTPAGYNARYQLQKLDRGESLETQLHYPIQTFSFGDALHMVFLAGEICADYSVRLKTELAAGRVWLNGYSNDFCAYIPSERLLMEGGYGGGSEVVYFALPATLQPGLEEKIIKAVKQITPESFQTPKGTRGVPPQEPDQALRTFQLDENLRIELVASEPLLADPVAIDFGPDGRLWVAEMPDYSREVDDSFEHSGRVKVLEDVDGDGVFDQATVFLRNLRFPTGVTVWRKGLLVCDAPHILYAEDQDGDGQADETRQLYTGFATHNPHARVNSLRYGLDNWVYGSSGLFGGNITSFGGETAQLNRADFRIQPDRGIIEAATGVTQQGRARDDWDNWFGCDNGGLAFHYPVYDHYVRRNPLVAPPAPHINMAEDAEAARLYPAGDLVLFQLSGNPGRATSACGLEIYRDELLGEEFTGNSFTCEPVHQAVHRLVLSRDGAVFRGRRAAEEQTREFLASTDQWFRPVQVRTGPDGALWIVDMYRYVIEHKRWIPESTLAELDVFAGQTRGRIYRIYAADRRPRPIPIVTEMSAVELVELLDHPNGVLRDMAQQQLVWRQQRSVSTELLHVARQAKVPAGRAQALWTLAGLQDALPDDALVHALSDPHPGVRRQALRLAETRLDKSQAVREAAERLATDESYEVRLQAAWSLGFTAEPSAAKALAELATAHPDDAYMLAAVKSSLHEKNVTAVLRALLYSSKHRPRMDVWVSFLSLAVQLGDAETLAFIVQSLTAAEAEPRWQFDALRHVLEGARQVRSAEQIAELIQQPQLSGWIEAARRLSVDVETETATRVAAVRLLARCPMDDRVALLASLLMPQHASEVQTAAAEALGQEANDDAARALIQHWDTATPALRRLVIDLLLQRPSSTLVLLTALEQQQVAAGSLDAARRQRLLEHNDPSIRDRAQKILQSPPQSDRLDVLARYAEASRVDGDLERGRTLFQKHCAACHKLGETGHAVGPDLAALVNKTPEYLLVAILDPHRVVEERYQSYAAQTVDGRVITGILTNETSTSVTLQEQEGKTHVLLRGDIEVLKATGKSLMPDGIEKDIAPDQLADLITLLMKLGPGGIAK